jgi:hypothetical protein
MKRLSQFLQLTQTQCSKNFNHISSLVLEFRRQITFKAFNKLLDPNIKTLKLKIIPFKKFPLQIFHINSTEAICFV